MMLKCLYLSRSLDNFDSMKRCLKNESIILKWALIIKKNDYF